MVERARDDEKIERDLFALLAESDPAIEPSAGLRARLLATVAPATRYEGFIERIARSFDLSAARTREILARVAGVAESPWVDGPEGVRLFHFEVGSALAGAHAGLVYIPPGGSFPEHAHVGEEIVFVLQGVLVERDGPDSWTAGDIARRPAGSRHALRCGGSEAVVFVAAVIGGIDIPLDAGPASTTA